MIIYQSWKFHENRPNQFWEILCTKSVRKKKNNKNREKETIQLDTISLRATRRSSVWFWCNQSKRWTNELQFRFRVWGNLLIQFVVSTVSECIWEVSYRLMSTQSQLFRQVMKPTGRLLGLEKLNIFMSYKIFISYLYRLIFT